MDLGCYSFFKISNKLCRNNVNGTDLNYGARKQTVSSMPLVSLQVILKIENSGINLLYVNLVEHYNNK